MINLDKEHSINGNEIVIQEENPDWITIFRDGYGSCLVAKISFEIVTETETTQSLKVLPEYIDVLNDFQSAILLTN